MGAPSQRDDHGYWTVRVRNFGTASAATLSNVSLAIGTTGGKGGKKGKK